MQTLKTLYIVSMQIYLYEIWLENLNMKVLKVLLFKHQIKQRLTQDYAKWPGFEMKMMAN